jgi:HK97 family phage major capsid protein
MAHMKRGEVQASLNKGADAEGGFVAPREWDRTITDKLVIVSEMRGLASTMVVGNAGFSKLYNLRGTVSGWVGETAARPETGTPTFGSMAVTTGEMYANPFITQQMLDDAEVDLETWLAGEVETEFAVQEGQAFVAGSGANGRPIGVLNYVTGGANAATNPLGAITTVNSGAADSVTADGIVNLVYALPSAFSANARFAMNRTVQGVVRLLKDSTGQYLWQPSYAAGQPATLAGYAVSELSALPNLAAGSKSILFGDFARTYRIVDRMGTRILRDPFSNKPYIGFYTTKRVGGFVDNPEAMKALNTAA